MNNKWFKKTIRAFIIGVISSFVFFPGFIFSSTENPYKVVLYYTLTFFFTYELIAVGVNIIRKKYNWINNTNQIIILNILLILVIFLPLNYLAVEINFGPYPENYSDMMKYFFKVNNFLIALMVLLYINGANFLESWKTSIIEKQELSKQQIKYELLALKNQINPHFLFNNLNTLSHLINEKDANAEEYIYEFSNIYRYLLEQKNTNIVKIEEEAKMIDSLLYLLKIKYEKSLIVNFNLKDFKGFKIAPFTLQMLIENIVKHNIISDKNIITIDIYKDYDYLCIKNNLTAKPNTVFSSGIGLENIKNRYKLLSKKEVKIIESKNEFIVKIPILKNGNINN